MQPTVFQSRVGRLKPLLSVKCGAVPVHSSSPREGDSVAVGERRLGNIHVGHVNKDIGIVTRYGSDVGSTNCKKRQRSVAALLTNNFECRHSIW